MAASLIDSLRDCVARRDQLYLHVESLATAEPGDDNYDANFSQHASSEPPHMTTCQAMHVQVSSYPSLRLSRLSPTRPSLADR